MHSLLVAALLTAAPLDSTPFYSELDVLYRDLHAHPELSGHEEKTAAIVAKQLRTLGFDVTEHVGGFGIVALLKNGKGPTVLVRADLDGLPVEEKTGLPYASKATTIDNGKTVSVMHACGHDVHMTSLIGAARLLVNAKTQWHGTLMLVGQPAEEMGAGAKDMVKDHFDRFPKPDVALALHDTPEVASGNVGIISGFALANVDSVTLTVFGKGGHGAYPHKTIDPIVISARIVTALQTLVSRETNPLEPAVVTVGSIHGGTRPNIVPDEVKLELSLRSYTSAQRKLLRDGVLRIAKGEALAAGAPKEPVMVVDEGPSAVYNDPMTTTRISAALVKALGAAHVVESQRVMGGEDFGEFGIALKCPSVMFWLGASDPGRLAAAQAKGETLPSTHSAQFAPDERATLITGANTLAAGALELFTPNVP